MLYIILWMKRLWKRPFFLFTLLLIPCSAWLLQHMGQDSAILRVALFVKGDSMDSLCQNLEQELLQISDGAVHFYSVSSLETLHQDIADNKAISGYVLPSDLEKKLSGFLQNRTPVFTAVQREGEMSNRILDEILLGKVYQTHAFQILEHFIEEAGKKQDIREGNSEKDFLEKQFSSYQTHELLFRFEYANGTENKLLQQNSNLLLLPLRGLISVMALLSCMAAMLLWYEKETQGFLLVCGKNRRRWSQMASLLAPAIPVGIFSFLSIQMSGISETFLTEAASMSCFLFACLSLIHFLRTFCKTRESFLSAIPAVTIGSLLFCPVFIDLSFNPVIRFLRYLFPTHYYLRSIYDIKEAGGMIIYGILLLGWLCHKK